MGTILRVGLLNLDWTKRGLRGFQARRLGEENLDVLCLLEIHTSDVAAFATEAGLAWHRFSLPPNSGRTMGVAILGGSRVEPSAVRQLHAGDFQAHGSGLDDAVAQVFTECQLAVDVRLGSGHMLRVGAFHAIPATGTTRNGTTQIGDRKPWFHDTVARWVATWPGPHLFGIDANTPRHDRLEWSATEFWWPPGRAAANEAVLLGERPLHRARDLWRAWLASAAGAHDLQKVPQDGPLARSYKSRGSTPWRRYDQIWASDGIRPLLMRYEYDPALSDHALVTATLSLP